MCVFGLNKEKDGIDNYSVKKKIILLCTLFSSPMQFCEVMKFMCVSSVNAGPFQDLI